MNTPTELLYFEQMVSDGRFQASAAYRREKTGKDLIIPAEDEPDERVTAKPLSHTFPQII
jgi:hypothetical protein